MAGDKMLRKNTTTRPITRPFPAAVVLAGIMFAGCYPASYSSSDETDVVVTTYDDEVDFQSKRTYAIPDKVIDLGKVVEGEEQPEDGRVTNYDCLILSTIESNLRAAGYTKEEDPENNPPDVLMLAGAAVQEWLVYYDWWYYWGWYPGWGYYPGFGPGWGIYYPPGCCATTYKTGTLIVYMVDPEDQDTEAKKANGIWIASITGLLSRSGHNHQTRIVKTINQAFDQSPYLKVK